MPAQLQSTSEGQTLVLTLSNPELRNASTPRCMPPASRHSTWPRAAPRCAAWSSPGEGACSAQAATCSACRPTAAAARGAGAKHRRPAQLDRDHPHLSQAGDCGRGRRCGRRRLFAGAGLRLHRGGRNAVFVMAYSNVALSPDGGASWSLAQRPAAPAGQRDADVRRAHRLPSACMTLGLVNRVTEPGQALTDRAGAGRAAQCARAQCAGQHQGTAERCAPQHADTSTWPASATTLSKTCTTPTAARASRPSSTKRPRATNSHPRRPTSAVGKGSRHAGDNPDVM
jgi:hypothetical protein